MRLWKQPPREEQRREAIWEKLNLNFSICRWRNVGMSNQIGMGGKGKREEGRGKRRQLRERERER